MKKAKNNDNEASIFTNKIYLKKKKKIRSKEKEIRDKNAYFTARNFPIYFIPFQKTSVNLKGLVFKSTFHSISVTSIACIMLKDWIRKWSITSENASG